MSYSAVGRPLGLACASFRGDHRLLPGGRVRADQQLRRHRRRAAPARALRHLHRRGVVRRNARGGRPTIEQLSGFIQPTWQALCDGARYVEPRLREILDEVDPDVIVEDNVVGFPALPASGPPWVRIVSCNPAELKDPHVPPTFSGYSARDRAGWDEFRAEYERTHRALWDDFDGFMRESGAPPLPDLEFTHESPWLNLFLYPDEADYSRSRPLGPTWHRLDSCVRATEEEWPELSAFEDGGALVYLSLGSLG
ncbi:MAG: hypothetical protein E6G64_14845, partial [Actinobacteria bacterium]